MKELLKKKSVKISLLFIILLVIMGIVGINVRSAQRQREYDGHVEAAEKYLTELDYEKAIAEYTMAFEIDPKEEVVDALEQTYLAYAQSLTDAGDYDKAIIILEEGYEKIGRESVQNKIEEFQVMQEEMLAKEAEQQEQKRLEEEQRRIEEEQRASGMVEFPFQLADITIMGFDLFENHFAELEALFPLEGGGTNGYGYTSDGLYYEIVNEGGGGRFIRVSFAGRNGNWLYRFENNTAMLYIDMTSYDSYVFDCPGLNVPVTAGEIYEDWCRVMQIDRIKENNLRPEERDDRAGIWGEAGDLLVYAPNPDYEDWLFSSGGYQGLYSEDRRDGYISCELQFATTNRPVYRIHVEINDGIITRIVYQAA